MIRAPFAGVLGIRQVSPGSLVTPGTAIATLDDIARVYVDFPVPEAAARAARAGPARVAAAATAYPERTFDGIGQHHRRARRPATRAVTVRADFANADRALRPGMLLQRRPAAAASGRRCWCRRSRSCRSAPTRSSTASKPDGTRRAGRVKIGARRDGQAEITEGVKAGDRIVVDGTGKLRAGQRRSSTRPTRAREADAAPARAAQPAELAA